jgi:hypothetical protein
MAAQYSHTSCRNEFRAYRGNDLPNLRREVERGMWAGAINSIHRIADLCYGH